MMGSLNAEMITGKMSFLGEPHFYVSKESGHSRKICRLSDISEASHIVFCAVLGDFWTSGREGNFFNFYANEFHSGVTRFV